MPIVDTLAGVLQAWKLKTGGTGLVVPPMRIDGENIDKHTPGHLPPAAAPGVRPRARRREPEGLVLLDSPHLRIQWAMSGRSLRELQAIMGHASLTETERYAHLVPGYFAPGVHTALSVDLTPGPESVAHVNAGSGRRPAVTTRNTNRKTGAAL